MELKTIIIALGIFLSPYLGYVWVYGFVLIKRLLAKELSRKKDLLKRYEVATSEQRMDVEVRDIADKPPTPPVEPPKGKGEWLDARNPEVVNRERQTQVFREGLHLPKKTPEGHLEKPKPAVPPPPVSRLP